MGVGGRSAREDGRTRSMRNPPWHRDELILALDLSGIPIWLKRCGKCRGLRNREALVIADQVLHSKSLAPAVVSDSGGLRCTRGALCSANAQPGFVEPTNRAWNHPDLRVPAPIA